MDKYKIKVDRWGAEHWLLNGVRHREDGPALKHLRGGLAWYVNGKLHREDGPAIKYSNYKGDAYWYVKGKLHREDGPAIEYCGGHKEWYIHDEQLTEETYLRIIKDG